VGGSIDYKFLSKTESKAEGLKNRVGRVVDYDFLDKAE